MFKFCKKIKHFFVPTPQNELRPYFFRDSAIAVVGIMAAASTAYFFSYMQLAFDRIPGTNLADIFASALVSGTNQFRESQGEKDLKASDLLSRAAQLKADDMAAKGYFSHMSPSGDMPWVWFDAVGYDYASAGENLAIDFVDSKDVVTAWENSPKHRHNLLNNDFAEVGIGLATGIYQGKQATFVVQFFGTTPDEDAQGGAGSAVAAASPAKSAKPRVVAAAPVPDASASASASSPEPQFLMSTSSITVVSAAGAASSTGEVLGANARGAGIAQAASSTVTASVGEPNAAIASGSLFQQAYFAALSAPRNSLMEILVCLLMLAALMAIVPWILLLRHHASEDPATRAHRVHLLHEEGLIAAVVVMLLIGLILAYVGYGTGGGATASAGEAATTSRPA